MVSRSALVGRQAERERLEGALEGARLGDGSLVLLAGEAGVGKTRLAEELAQGSGALVLFGRASQRAPAPYAPLVAALRSHLRSHPEGLGDCGPLRPHLALLLPELGDPAAASDRATLHEAVLRALAHLAREATVLLVLDDLQWSDDATLELLPTLAEPLAGLPVLVVASYRSDGLPRDHMVRRLRHELRRRGRLDELTLAPLAPDETAELLARILEGAPSTALAREIHDRTQGVPFYVEEFARALLATRSVTPGRSGLEPAGDAVVPMPDTIRDAVLMSASDLSPAGRSTAEAAAVAGDDFDLQLIGVVSSSAGVTELLARGWISEEGVGRGAFRHALAREALYAEVPWLERQTLHRRLAMALEASRGRSLEVATHWLGARDDVRARDALLRAASDSRAVHAHRDATRAWRRALELWPEDDDRERRIDVLASYAGSAELCGELAEAARAWREICTLTAGLGATDRLADAQRRLAAVQDLAGDRGSAAAARRAAAEAYASAGRPADAAMERLAIADHLTTDARHSDAIEMARAAAAEAGVAKRVDLRARALGLEGMARARRGDFDAGHATVRTGLSLALEHGLTSIAAELYQRLGVVLYNSADYRRAEETLGTAFELCRDGEVPETELAYLVCMVYVLRERGDWPRATALGQQLSADEGNAWLGQGLVGTIQAYQGRLRSARRMLTSSLAVSSRVGHYPMFVEGTAGLAWVAAAEGADDEAAALCRSLLARWDSSEDRHYAVRALRWGAGFLARRGDLEGAHECTAALTRIASDSGHADALAGLAHAIGETALADGDPATAAEQILRAAELHRGLDIPYERAEIELRAGVALAAAGERGRALDRLRDAHRTARGLGARPLATEAAREAAALGEPVARRLGRRAAADADGAGLSRRELEVVRFVAAGRTNREIAQELVLSPRTVDMHVRNLLRKLDCRSRTEAAGRAAELGLLA